MYADNITDSIKSALAETERRRNKQIQYNKKYKITPKSVIKAIPDKATTKSDIDFKTLTKSIARSDLLKLAIETEATMKKFAEELDFEKAIEFREKLTKIKNMLEERTHVEVL
jgi:excinuclease ABC subunit B